MIPSLFSETASHSIGQNRERSQQRKTRTEERMDVGTAVAVVGGAGLFVAATPFALGALGFSSAGIAAGSIGAKMMSAAAVANGGGVAAGGLVAALQSAGAAGLSGVTTAAVAGVGGAVGALARLIR